MAACNYNVNSEPTAFVGVEVPENYPLIKNMDLKIIPSGRYARFIHKGTVDTLLQTYHFIWGVWFPKSGFELDERDDFECYTQRFLGPNNQKSEIDIYFIIKKIE